VYPVKLLYEILAKRIEYSKTLVWNLG